MLNIQESVPMDKQTTFRVGGPARFFVEVKDVEELKEALRYAAENKLEFFILGGGSNLLVSDKGFDGLVIKIKFSEVQVMDEMIEIGAGVPLAKVVRTAAEAGLAGMEWASGIPGTFGGAVRGNAGAFGGETKDVLESVQVLNAENLEIIECTQDECEYGYRSSKFKHNPHFVILSGRIRLKKGDAAEIQKKGQEIIAGRVAKQPQGGSAGSFFINPVVDKDELIAEFEKEKGVKSKEHKVPAGWLIEKADLKGKRIGGAQVSDIHPNYILNVDKATAEDVIILSSFIKQQIRDKFGVQLREEVQFLGF